MLYLLRSLTKINNNNNTKNKQTVQYQELYDHFQFLGFFKTKISDNVVNDTEYYNNLHASCSCSRGWLGSPLFPPKQSVL